MLSQMTVIPGCRAAVRSRRHCPARLAEDGTKIQPGQLEQGCENCASVRVHCVSVRGARFWHFRLSPA